jgi:hypothetical protein
MLDISGPSSAPSTVTGGQPKGPSGSRGVRIWGVLLVLDFFFVIVFGGALAAKIYQHLAAPAAPVAPPRRVKPAAKTAENPKPVETPKTPPAPKKTEPIAPVAKNGLPPPKPSLLNEAPKREPAKPHDASAQKAAAPNAAPPSDAADGAKVKAVAVNFQISAPGAKKVELAGAFIVRGNGMKEMKEKDDGQWSLTLYLTPNTYRYHFLVDGKKTLDPQNSKTDRGASVISVP